jgi:hypothetical protein
MEIPSDVTRQLVETSSVKEAVLFANTPSFLMQRLRRDSATSYLAQALTMRESIDVLLTVQRPHDVTELLWAYVLLASLFLRDDISEFTEMIRNMDVSSIQWGDDIRTSLLAEMIPTSFNKVEYEEPNTMTTTDGATVRAEQLEVVS